MKTYAVKWREPDGQTFIGRLALGSRALRLDGRRCGGEDPPVSRRFGYAELRGPRIDSGGAQRLDGRPALVVERPDGDYLVAGAGLGAPIVQELVDRLAELRLAPPAPRKNAAANPQEVCVLPRITRRGAGPRLRP